MAGKRGRPIASTSDNDKINRRRLETRERVRRIRLQRKGPETVDSQPPIEQLQHGEQIVNLDQTGNEEAPQTPAATNQRTEDVAFTFKADKTQFDQEIKLVDEHREIAVSHWFSGSDQPQHYPQSTTGNSRRSTIPQSQFTQSPRNQSNLGVHQCEAHSKLSSPSSSVPSGNQSVVRLNSTPSPSTQSDASSLRYE